MAFEEDSFLKLMYSNEQFFKNKIALMTDDLKQRTVTLEKLTPSKEEVENFVKYVPRERQEQVVYKFNEHFKQLDYLKRLHEGYVKLEIEIAKFSDYIKYAHRPEAVQQFLQNHPVYSDKIKKPEDLLKMYMNMIRAASGYGKVWKSAAEKMAKIDYDIHKIVHSYGWEWKKTSHAANIVPIIISVGFAGLTLYALSQINPENVTIGAFFAGSNSSVLLTMLSAVVIFLLFFLTHHKLK